MITHKIYTVPKHTMSETSVAAAKAPEWVDQERYMVADNQGDLKSKIINSGYLPGSFVTFDGAACHSLACIHVVAQIEADFEKVERNKINNAVRPFKVVQCDKWSPAAHCWVRWDDLRHMRRVTEKEYKTFVEPKLADIQNSLEQVFPPNFKLPALGF